jgi:hypothetical protein
MMNRPARRGARHHATATALPVVFALVGAVAACAPRRTGETIAPSTTEIIPGALLAATVERDGTSPEVLRAHARFTNHARDTVRFGMGDDWCALTVRAYTHGALPRQLVWSSDQPPAPGEGLIGCSHVLRRVVLAPGASEELDATYRPRLNLGHALPRGRYDMTVRLNLFEPKGTTGEVSAGGLAVEP